MRFLACISPLDGLSGIGPSSRMMLRDREWQSSSPNIRCGWLRLIVRTTGRISRRSPRHPTRWHHLQAHKFHVKHVRELVTV